MEFVSKSEKDTRKIAKELANKILLGETGNVIALYGDLGSGKTTFTQFFARAIGVKEKILSPTFVIIKTFDIRDANPFDKLRAGTRIHPTSPGLRGESANDANRFKHLVHIDTYRLKSARDLLGLGLKDILKDKENIVVIEWPEKIAKLLPKNTIKMYFETISEEERKIQIISNSQYLISNKT